MSQKDIFVVPSLSRAERTDSGSNLVEFAIVAPVLLFSLLMFIQAGVWLFSIGVAQYAGYRACRLGANTGGINLAASWEAQRVLAIGRFEKEPEVNIWSTEVGMGKGIEGRRILSVQIEAEPVIFDWPFAKDYLQEIVPIYDRVTTCRLEKYYSY